MKNATRYKSIFVLAFVCLFAIGFLESKDSGKSDASTDDEYIVYAAAMKEVVGGGSYVVMDTTSIHGNPENIDRALSFPIEDADSVTDDLVGDLKSKNQKSHPIAQHFPADAHVTLITEHERSAMFAGCIKCGWKTFYEKYWGAHGITSLSRVGFNRKHDTALVYIGNVRDWEVGSGMYLLLTKNDGEWKVISKTQGWIA